MLIGTILGTLAIVLITVVIGLVIDRKRRLLPAPEDFDKQRERNKPPTYTAGEAPASAIRARPQQLVKLREQRCTECRAPMTNEADDTVRYDARELLVLHFACTKCQAKRSLYVERV